jgi:chromosome segregation ATPase
MERDTAEEIKRHFDAIAGGLRSEIRAVGDGLVATNERQDRTAKAIDEKLDRTAKALDEKLDRTAKALDEKLDRTDAKLDRTIERLDRTDAKLDRTIERLDQLDKKLDQGFEEVKRHFEVVAEGMGSQIRMVAEGFVATNERLDRFEVRVSDQFGGMESMMRLSFSELDRRIQTLASR